MVVGLDIVGRVSFEGVGGSGDLEARRHFTVWRTACEWRTGVVGVTEIEGQVEFLIPVDGTWEGSDGTEIGVEVAVLDLEVITGDLVQVGFRPEQGTS